MEREEPLGDRLVLGEVKPRGSGAGVGNPEKVEVGRDVDVLGVVPGVGLGQVEHEIDLGRGKRLQCLGASVEAEVFRPMTFLRERVEDFLAVRLVAAPFPLRDVLRRRIGGRFLVLDPVVVEDADFERR